MFFNYQLSDQKKKVETFGCEQVSRIESRHFLLCSCGEVTFDVSSMLKNKINPLLEQIICDDCVLNKSTCLRC